MLLIFVLILFKLCQADKWVLSSDTTFKHGPSISNGLISMTFKDDGVKDFYSKNYFVQTSYSSVLQMRSIEYPDLNIITDNGLANICSGSKIYALNMYSASYSCKTDNTLATYVILRHLPSVTVLQVESSTYNGYYNIITCKNKCNFGEYKDIMIMCTDDYCVGSLVIPKDVKIIQDSYDSYYQIFNSKKFTVYTSTVTKNDHQDPYNQVIRNLVHVNSNPVEHSITLHYDEWAKLWTKGSNIDNIDVKTM
jgi:hypothetical protein